jgi:hypothetical protein
MNKVNNYNDFLLDKIFEDNKPKGHGVNELPFVISHTLKKILQSINHTIATKILEIDEKRKEEKVTFVDIDKDKENYFSIVNSNKAYDNAFNKYKDKIEDLGEDKIKDAFKRIKPGSSTYLEDYWIKNRSSIRIGAFINKVFPNEFKSGGSPGEDIESFVQAIIAKRQVTNKFKLVEGEDIVKYYNSDMYDTKNENGDEIIGTSLQKSCMRYSNCSEYIEFYSENNVKLLILFSDVVGREDLIVGRAIVWELSYPSGRTFMDRIYYRHESDMAMFKQYADSKGWLYKSSQNMGASTAIVDPRKNGDSDYLTLRTTKDFKKSSNNTYPYMDTLKYFYVDYEYLSNKEPNSDETVYLLESTSGEYDELNTEPEGIYIEYYDDYFDEDDVVYCELGDDYRTNDDAIYIERYGQYATERYVERNLVWSDYEDTYIETDDAVWSDYHNDYIDNNNSITMYIGADEKNIEDVSESDDVRHENEIGDSVISYDPYYFDMNDYGDYFVKVNVNGYNSYKEYKHKVWDKDKLFKFNGEWYYEYDSYIKDKVIGQKRIDFNE